MTTPPRRRWFRFSLRTFFVVVVLLAAPCAWVARELAVARERKALLKWLEEETAETDRTASVADRPTHWRAWINEGDVSWWTLGESRSVVLVQHPAEATEEQIQQVKDLFPEANVVPY